MNERLQTLLDRQSGRCLWCGLTCWLADRDEKGHYERRATIEHLVPRKHGGSDRVENLAAACHRCNIRRGHRADELIARPQIVALLTREQKFSLSNAEHIGRKNRRNEIPAFLRPGYRWTAP